MKRLLFSLFLFDAGSVAVVQWQPLGSMTPFSVPYVVNHHDKAYAIIEGRLCAGDNESENRYAFYPIDQSAWKASFLSICFHKANDRT